MRLDRDSSWCINSAVLSRGARRAFTIIELLVVIGIISILAIALLVTLNPAQAQRQARDTQRLKDANTLQTIISQYYQDPSNALICSDAPCISTGGTGTANSQPCDASNWLGVDLCQFAQTIPSDPINRADQQCAWHDGTDPQVTDSCNLVYTVASLGNDYEINVPQESIDNASALISDNGTNPYLFEIVTDARNQPIANAGINNTGPEVTIDPDPDPTSAPGGGDPPAATNTPVPTNTPAPTATPEPSTLLNDIVAYWDFNEVTLGDRLDEISGVVLYPRDSNPAGVLFGPGIVGNAIYTTRTNARYLQSDYPQLPDLTPPYTISLWARPDRYDDDGIMLNFTNANTGITIGYLSPYLAIEVEDAPDLRVGGTTFLDWGHVVVQVNDDDTFNTWLDGSPVVTEGGSGFNISSSTFYVGARSGSSYGFDGLIDELGFWSRSLTNDEIAELYNNGSGVTYPFTPAHQGIPQPTAGPTPTLVPGTPSLMDGIVTYWSMDESSGNREDDVGTADLVDSRSVPSTTGKIGNAAVIDDSPRQIFELSPESISLTEPYTLSLWIRTTDTAGIITNYHSELSDKYFNLGFSSGDILFSSENFANRIDLADLSAFADWGHIVIVFIDDTNAEFWINGQQQTLTTGGAWNIHGGIFTVGGRNGGDEALETDLDEFGIWDRQLTPTEIAALYNSGNGLAYPFE